MLDENLIEMKYEEIRKRLWALRRSSSNYRRNGEYMKKKPVEYWKHKHNLDVENLQSTKRNSEMDT
ncbi:MAG: hypothetical protein QG670_1423 [Thermoproteota archaeon]|nr:hypothetical protein [Thermoproteota archaeon]